MTTPTTGSLAVLNTGAGDIIVTFNDHDDAETDKAIAMLCDMQQRGYAILVRQDDGTYVRAVSIDRATKSYVVVPPAVETAPAIDVPEKPRRGRAGRKRIAVRGATGVAVARSAGGCARRAPAMLLSVARCRASGAEQAGTASGTGAVRRTVLFPGGLSS